MTSQVELGFHLVKPEGERRAPIGLIVNHEKLNSLSHARTIKPGGEGGQCCSSSLLQTNVILGGLGRFTALVINRVINHSKGVRIVTTAEVRPGLF